jgi:hypothetical protein
VGDLTDLATARQALPRLASVPDAEISRLISEASDVIQTYTNRQFGAATFTETLNSGVSGSIFIRNPPITSITSITIGYPNNPVVLDPTSYRFDARTGEIRGVRSNMMFPWDFALFGLFDSFGYGWQSVQIVYQGAFATIPPKVAGLCLSLVNRSAADLANDPGTRSRTFGAVSYTSLLPSETMTLTDSDKGILSLYRVWSL